MDYPSVICSQYLAALKMLEQAIDKCPASLWNRAGDSAKFWQVAYHVLFYTNLYLSPTEAHFTPWPNCRQGYHNMGPDSEEPYQKAELLEYVTFCRQQIKQQVPALDLAAPSGFDWLAMNKLELQIYTIRHLQQHTGELMERLGSQANIAVDWIGMEK
jgi:hypothetical protein